MSLIIESINWVTVRAQQLSFPSLVLGGFIGMVSILYFKIKHKPKNKPKIKMVSKPSKWLIKNISNKEEEKRLYMRIQEQLGDCYLVQYGTSITAITDNNNNQSLPETSINVLLLDPLNLAPKLALILTPGDSIWYGQAKSEHLALMRILDEIKVPVITLPEQDYYKIDAVISSMLDELRDPDEFFILDNVKPFSY